LCLIRPLIAFALQLSQQLLVLAGIGRAERQDGHHTLDGGVPVARLHEHFPRHVELIDGILSAPQLTVQVGQAAVKGGLLRRILHHGGQVFQRFLLLLVADQVIGVIVQLAQGLGGLVQAEVEVYQHGAGFFIVRL